MPIAVLADIVDSRRLEDRDAVQSRLEQILTATHREHPFADEPMTPSVGDEFQAVYPSLETALASIMLIRLSLARPIDLRFGLGWGAVKSVDSQRHIQDGPGWWAARQAIEEIESKSGPRRRVVGARSWLVVAPDEDASARTAAAIANAYLLSRDQLISRMSDRARRLTLGALRGRTQEELAKAEGIRQSAVSQALSKAGSAALLAGWDELRREAGA